MKKGKRKKKKKSLRQREKICPESYSEEVEAPEIDPTQFDFNVQALKFYASLPHDRLGWLTNVFVFFYPIMSHVLF